MSGVWFDKCVECGNDTFKVRMNPTGEVAIYIDWYCSKCETHMGGVLNDPLNEVSENQSSEQKVN